MLVLSCSAKHVRSYKPHEDLSKCCDMSVELFDIRALRSLLVVYSPEHSLLVG